MLIQKLQELKEVINTANLYLARRTRTGFLRRVMFEFSSAIKFGLVSSHITWLQRDLSFICGQMCSILVRWDDIGDSERKIWIEDLQPYLNHVKIHPSILRFSGSQFKVKSLDPFYIRERGLAAAAKQEIQLWKESLSHYSGVTVGHDFEFDATFAGIELISLITELKGKNLADHIAMNQAIDLIGRKYHHSIFNVNGIPNS